MLGVGHFYFGSTKNALVKPWFFYNNFWNRYRYFSYDQNLNGQFYFLIVDSLDNSIKTKNVKQYAE